jgi:hypothetical protein
LIDDASELSYRKKLQDAKDYIGEPSLNVLTNRESIQLESDDLIYATDIFTQQFDINSPSFIDS